MKCTVALPGESMEGMTVLLTENMENTEGMAVLLVENTDCEAALRRSGVVGRP